MSKGAIESRASSGVCSGFHHQSRTGYYLCIFERFCPVGEITIHISFKNILIFTKYISKAFGGKEIAPLPCGIITVKNRISRLF